MYVRQLPNRLGVSCQPKRVTPRWFYSVGRTPRRETCCTHLWAKRYAYIYDEADSPSSASSASSDYPWDKPKKDIPRDILLEDSLLEREFHGGSTPSSVANSDESKHTRLKRRRTFKAPDTIGFLWDLPHFSGPYWDQFSEADDQGLAVPPCAEDLSDGEILTGLYWSTHFAQH